MTEPILPKNIRKILKKAIAAILAVAFLFNDVAFAQNYQNLAPWKVADSPEFHEEFTEAARADAMNYINMHIESIGGFDKLKRRDDAVISAAGRVKIEIAGIPGLFAKFGQRSYPGYWVDKPVIFVDDNPKYFRDESAVTEAKEQIKAKSAIATAEDAIVNGLYQSGQTIITALNKETFLFKYSVKDPKEEEKDVQSDLVIEIYEKSGKREKFIGYLHAVLTKGEDWERSIVFRTALYPNRIFKGELFRLGAPGFYVENGYQERGVGRTAISLLLRIGQRLKAGNVKADGVITQERVEFYKDLGFKLLGRVGNHVDAESGETLEFQLNPEYSPVTFPVIGIDAPSKPAPAGNANDVTIADHERKDMTRAGHDEYQAGLGEEIERIAHALEAEYGKIETYKDRYGKKTL